MNLIEQLGGYEKAKEKMDDICHTLDNSELLGGGDAREGLYERLESIDKALLEYRRQHNIFEVGDYILPISNHSDQVHFLSEWYIENLDFRYTTKSGSWGIIIKACMVGAWRHATDLEIEVGHRL